MIVLLLGLVFLLVLSYIVAHRDMFHPVFLCCAFFFISALCTSYNINYWGVNLCAETITLILFSLFFMIAGGTLATHIRGESGNEVVELSPIIIDKIKIAIIVALGLLSTVLYFRDVMRIANANGYASGSGLTALMNAYRNASHFSTEESNSVSKLSYYSMMAFRLASYLLTYIGINNLICKTKKRQYLNCFLVTGLFCVTSLMTASRMQLLKIAIFIIIIYFILLKKAKGWEKKVSPLTVLKLALAGIALMALFVAVRTLVGRSNAESPFYYITKYAGGSIHLLDLFIKNPMEASGIWGKETFYAMYKFLGPKLGRSDWVYVFAKEFRRSNGVALGNVYTALRCFYYDFGYVGCLVCSAIVGYVLSAVYAKIHRSRLKGKVDMRLLLYAYLSYSYCLFSVNFYFDYLTVAFIKWIILFYIIRWFLVEFNLTSGQKYEFVEAPETNEQGN